MTGSAVSVKLTQDERARLSRAAKATKRSAHYIMREAVTKHLDRIESDLAFLREAEEGWKHYKETGAYYSAETIEKWAASGGGELPPPEHTWEK